MAVKPVLLAGSLAALMFLAGCPSQPQRAAPTPALATAPVLRQAPQANAQANPALAPSVRGNDTREQAAAREERDSELVASVEKAYQAGLNNYQQGQLAAARANFDYAVDLMLRCNCDIRQDPAISDEFDRIVDAVNTLELDALRQGGTQNGQAQEPSPVDVAGNITTPANPTVAATASAELKTTRSDLPLVMNQYVANYIDFFTNNPRGHATIVNSLERMGRYKAMIQKVLKENGVPQDLIYQAVAESGFRPQIVNRSSGAAGMWQFMPWGTYGLEHNAWVDQRFDPVASTEAYAREIRKMHDQLGDWYLAMAAYDWGPGNIQKAVERTGYADFWQLYQRNNLPQETKNYVPIILAVTIMAKNPKQYGLTGLDPDPPLLTDTVTTDNEISLRLVSDIVGVPAQEIETLNPALLRMSTPPDEPYDLRLPAGTGPLFQREIAEIPVDKRRYWRLQTVTAGDTLESVAHKWHVPVQDLAFVNQLGPGSGLSGVDALVIPLAPSSEPRALRGGQYRVRRGDTLVSVADRFGVSVEDLRAWNRLRGNLIDVGHRLYVARPARTGEFRRSRHTTRERGGTYRVRRGDTLGGIADRFHISVVELRRWNHLRGNEIRVGHTLRVAAP